MKKLQICGVGQSIVDLLYKVSDSELRQLGLTAGTRTLLNDAELKRLNSNLSGKPFQLQGGGSLANSLVAISQLGARTALITTTGDDAHGSVFAAQLEKDGVKVIRAVCGDLPTGTCAVLTTPDSNRTMCTHLGAASRLEISNSDCEIINMSNWALLEGYLLQLATHKVFDQILVLQGRNKIALSLSDPVIVKAHRQKIKESLAKVDLVFANEEEACVLTGLDNGKQAFVALTKFGSKGVSVTFGKNGAMLYIEGRTYEIESFPCQPVDSTGAGDMFTGALIYGLANGYAPEAAGRGAAYLAMKVVSQTGARLDRRITDYWQEVTKR